MVTLTYERDGRRWTEEFSLLNDCIHSAALRLLEHSGEPKAISTDDGRRWSGDSLRNLLNEMTRRHGWK